MKKPNERRLMSDNLPDLYEHTEAPAVQEARPVWQQYRDERVAAELKNLREILKSSAPAEATMKDHEIASLVSAIVKAANDFAGTQQLRDRIAHLVVPALKRVHATS